MISFAATLSHWATKKDVDASPAVANLTNILTEKIQDSIKAERRLQASQE